MDNRDVQVRHNHKYVMQQCRSHALSRYYWIDAVCIDQNILGERSNQVLDIWSIFKCATYVYACIGENEEGSAFLMSELARFPVIEILSEKSTDQVWSRVTDHASAIRNRCQSPQEVPELSLMCIQALETGATVFDGGLLNGTSPCLALESDTLAYSSRLR
jgi:hypothetical protein